MENSGNSSLLKYKAFQKHTLYKNCLSALIVALATSMHYVLGDFIHPAPFLLYFPAIILGSLYGDGISAIFFSCLSWLYFFTGEPFEIIMSWPKDYVTIGIFLVSSALIREVVRNQVKAKLKAESVAELLNEEKEAREKFVSALTHDLQTPLTSVKLQIQMILRKEDISEKTALSLKKVEKNIMRIEDMIRDLLDANKIKAGKVLPLELSACNLREVIETSIQGLEVIYGKRFFIKKAESVEGIWCFEALQRILENLVLNAVKYGDPEAPIEICGEKASDGILLSVNNKGPVISSADQQKIFNPFHQIKISKSGQKGWGIGLSLVKGLTEAHGGSVKLLSSEAEGTTFFIHLPIDSRPHQNFDLDINQP